MCWSVWCQALRFVTLLRAVSNLKHIISTSLMEALKQRGLVIQDLITENAAAAQDPESLSCPQEVQLLQ